MANYMMGEAWQQVDGAYFDNDIDSAALACRSATALGNNYSKLSPAAKD